MGPVLEYIIVVLHHVFNAGDRFIIVDLVKELKKMYTFFFNVGDNCICWFNHEDNTYVGLVEEEENKKINLI